jgi:hypothetical protein
MYEYQYGISCADLYDFAKMNNFFLLNGQEIWSPTVYRHGTEEGERKILRYILCAYIPVPY